MQRSGRIVQRTLRVNTTTEVKVPVPRKSTPKSRSQNLFGDNWNTGGGNTSPHSDSTNATTEPTVSGATGLTWNDGTDMTTTTLTKTAGGTVNEVLLSASDSRSFSNYGARTKEIFFRNRRDSITDALAVDSDNGIIAEVAGTGVDRVEISFDNGNNYITLMPGQGVGVSANVYYFLIRRSDTDLRTPVVEFLAVLQ